MLAKSHFLPGERGQVERVKVQVQVKRSFTIRLFAFFLFCKQNIFASPQRAVSAIFIQISWPNYKGSCYIKYNFPEIMQNKKRAHCDSVFNQFLTAQDLGSRSVEAKKL
jgi:hypothetical protein